MPERCPQCGASLPAGALAGLCPACLLQQGAAADTVTHAEGRPFVPPTVEEVAKCFPGLEILELLGRGGMGAVYKARQKELDRLVALKILPPRSGNDSAFAERFTREARALARLNHPGIVTLYEFGKVDSQPSTLNPQPPLYYFLMEYVDGVSLGQLLRSSRVAPREALAIVPQICDALQYAHDQGIVHRDIKPENILLDRRGRVKVADFGLAKIVEANVPLTPALSPLDGERVAGRPGEGSPPVLTEAGKIMGTPKYMSPEQIEAPREVDHRADIYALGVVFYQMLTGELPGKPIEPPSHKVQVDVRLDEVVLRALERKPELRYQQASVLKTQVETIASTPTAASPAATVPWMHRGVDYRSKATLFGLPWLHVTAGVDPATGRQRVAKGIIAIGGIAKGVVAIGGVAMGGLAFGGLAVGVCAYGGLAIGLLALGGGAAALVAALGGGAIAPIALGGGAMGYFAYGGGALGVHVLDATTKDPAAQRFFLPWAKTLLAHFQLINACLLIPLLGIGVGVPLWLQWRTARGASGGGGQGGGQEQPSPGPAASHGNPWFAFCTTLTYAGTGVWGVLCELFRGSVPGGWLIGAFVLLACATLVLSLLLRRFASLEHQRSAFRVGAWLAFLTALPLVGFAAFFVLAVIDEGFGWNPAPDEAVVVPLIWLGALLLPVCGWRLWRAASRSSGGSRREEAHAGVEKPSQSWWTWSPLQSQEVGEICSHLTKAERNHLSVLGLLFAIWIPGTCFGIPAFLRSDLGSGKWIVALVWVILFAVSIPMLQRMVRHFLCTTAWARERGFAPDHLRLFSFNRGNLWKLCAVLAVGLGFVFAQHKAITSYLGLGSSPQSSQVQARHPGKAAATAQDPSFGPVIERVLPDPDDRRENETLSLRTGALASVLHGAKADGGGRIRSLVASEGDLYAEYDDYVGRRWALITHGLKLSDMTPSQWESASIADLNTALQTATVVDHVEPPEVVGATLYLLPDGLQPMTFAFQTREGVRGLMQITRFTDNPRGVRMRYKLLQRTAQSAPAEATNQDGGSHEHAQILAKLHALKIERGAESSRWAKISEELSDLSKPQVREILPRVVGRDELLERLLSSLKSAQERLSVFDATNEPSSAPGKTEREELANLVVQLERKTDERIEGILQGLKVRTDSIEAGVKGLEQAIEDAQRPKPGLPPGTATQLAAGFQVRLVAPEGSTEPADDLADPGDPAGRRQVRVLRQVLLDGSAIARAGYELPYGWKLEGGTIFSITTGRSEPNLKRCIELDLTLAGGRAWEEITATNLNRQLAIVFRGQVLFLKVIRQRLAGTHLTINAPLSADLVRKVVAALNAVPGSPPQAWEFSEPIEATLLWQPRAYSAIDLESGRCLTNSNPDLPPPGSTSGVPPALHEWMLTNNLDLTILNGSAVSFSLGSCDTATCPITVNGRSPLSLLTAPTNGYPITAADVVYNWSLMTRDEQSSRVMFGTISSNQLDSFLFRTRKGCLGVLEVLRAPTNTPGVTICYKRVQAAAVGAKRASAGSSPSAAAQLRQAFLSQLAASVPMRDYGYAIKDLSFSPDLQKALVVFTNAQSPRPERENILSESTRPKWEFTLVSDGFQRYVGSAMQPFYTPGTANTPPIHLVVDTQAKETPAESVQSATFKLRQEFLPQLAEAIPMKQYGYQIKDLRFSADLQRALVVLTNALSPPPGRENILSASARPRWEFILVSDGFRGYVGSAMQPFYTPGTANTPPVQIKVVRQPAVSPTP